MTTLATLPSLLYCYYYCSYRKYNDVLYCLFLLSMLLNVKEMNDTRFCINKGINNAWFCRITTQFVHHNNANHEHCNVQSTLLVLVEIDIFSVPYMLGTKNLLSNWLELRCHHVQVIKSYCDVHYHTLLHTGLWLQLLLQTEIINAINQVQTSFLLCNVINDVVIWFHVT